MHTIRLRGPWQVEPIERFEFQADGSYRAVRENLPAAQRATMPADWSALFGADFLGRVRYRRVFQKPTGLDAGERVWLVVEPARSQTVVELNRKRLGEVVRDGTPLRFDVTELLDDHNRLEILVEHPALDECGRASQDSNTAGPGGLVGEVRLEIEE